MKNHQAIFKIVAGSKELVKAIENVSYYRQESFAADITRYVKAIMSQIYVKM